MCSTVRKCVMIHYQAFSSTGFKPVFTQWEDLVFTYITVGNLPGVSIFASCLGMGSVVRVVPKV